MIYSKTCEYAIRALIFFALHPEKDRASMKEVSRESGVPGAYVAKIFQCLGGAGILRSHRGPNGGYEMLVNPSSLTLLKVIRSLDDPARSALSRCVMGFERCDDRNPCPLHPIWTHAKEKMTQRLSATTITDVADCGSRFSSARHRRLVLSKRMRSIFSI